MQESHNAICGILGNMEKESTFSPGIWHGLDENSNVFGLTQWCPSEKLFDWAENIGGNAYDIDTQLKKILSEVGERYGQWQSILNESHMSFEEYTHSNEPVGYLAEVFLRSYENPENVDKEVTKRAEAAENWSKYFLGESE